MWVKQKKNNSLDVYFFNVSCHKININDIFMLMRESRLLLDKQGSTVSRYLETCLFLWYLCQNIINAILFIPGEFNSVSQHHHATTYCRLWYHTWETNFHLFKSFCKTTSNKFGNIQSEQRVSSYIWATLQLHSISRRLWKTTSQLE